MTVHFGGYFSTWGWLGAVEEMLQQLQNSFCLGRAAKLQVYVEELDLKHGKVGGEGLEMLNTKSQAGRRWFSLV